LYLIEFDGPKEKKNASRMARMPLVLEQRKKLKQVNGH